jgi:hypothetical protein
MDELIEKHHPHLAEAKIAIAWRFGWSQDADGLLKLGQAKKVSELDRDLHDYDFIILLNHEVWNKASFSERQMKALIDHELCHCSVSIDTNGEKKIDERGRVIYRIRKHDVEEFREVAARHGCWRDDLRQLAEAAIEKDHNPLFAGGKAKATAKPAHA